VPPASPDLVMVKGKRLVFAECKAARGKVSQTQQDWLEALRQVPCAEVHVWRAGTNTLQDIAEVLK